MGLWSTFMGHRELYDVLLHVCLRIGRIVECIDRSFVEKCHRTETLRRSVCRLRSRSTTSDWPDSECRRHGRPWPKSHQTSGKYSHKMFPTIGLIKLSNFSEYEPKIRLRSLIESYIKFNYSFCVDRIHTVALILLIKHIVDHNLSRLCMMTIDFFSASCRRA